MKEYHLNCRGKVIPLQPEPVIMGILNVTPDSFSDGGAYLDCNRAVERGLQMAAEGAGIIDVGGESTRPGAQAVNAEEQIKRVVPVIKELARQTEVPISIDTRIARVAELALNAGASMINDISALNFDRGMTRLAVGAKVPVVLMHLKGDPENMQQGPHYDNVLAEVMSFLARRIKFAQEAGISKDLLVVDPGIGFGKNLEHNLTIIRFIKNFHRLGVPVLVGPSRKQFIGSILQIDEPQQRAFGTAAVVAWCAFSGVHIIRVHDVKEMVQVVRVLGALAGTEHP
jgi:dihydropteroate synthase